MINKNPCNGWTNYETWKVKLELLDGYEPHYRNVDDIAQELEEYCEEIIDHETMRKGFAYDCAMQVLSQVNWKEIAENIYDDEEEDDEEEDDEE